MKSGACGLILESPFHNPLRRWNSFTPNGLPGSSGTAPERALKAKNQNPLARGAKTPSSLAAFLRAPDAGSGDPAYRGLTGEAVPCRQGAVPRSQPRECSPDIHRPQEGANRSLGRFALAAASTKLSVATDDRPQAHPKRSGNSKGGSLSSRSGDLASLAHVTVLVGWLAADFVGTDRSCSGQGPHLPGWSHIPSRGTSPLGRLCAL